MKKPLLLAIALLLTIAVVWNYATESEQEIEKQVQISETENATPKLPKKTPEQRALFAEERAKYEFKLQRNPSTGEIPKLEKIEEFENAKRAKLRSEAGEELRAADAAFISRGPTNLGGRTRAIVVDVSDNTGNTILAGGVSSGLFRTTNGGASWTKVSPNNEIHNVTAIAQDPTNTNIWYYGTGEAYGNSTSGGGAFYLGRGIWRSTDSGVTWTQMATTNSTQEVFDSTFDLVHNIAVHPTTGDVYAAITGQVVRFNGVSWGAVVSSGSISSSSQSSDVVITSGGRVFVSMAGTNDAASEGVWTSATGVGGWTRISTATIHTNLVGRAVLGLAPSNQDKLYVLFNNGVSSSCSGTPAVEADLWMWDQGGSSWTDYSAKLPDEGGCSDGNDPFAIQGGYDLVVSVKPDAENFVVIGGTNAYKIADITGISPFVRIGGYANAFGYSLYDTAGGAEHHPDIHAMHFSPFNSSVLFTGTDGGVHRTDDVTAGTVDWVTLNNNYVTQQYYHVAIDPLSGSDVVTGGLQDNGTNFGGTSAVGPNAAQPDLTTQTRFFGGDGVAVGISRDNACVPLFCGFQNGIMYRYCSGWSAPIDPAGSFSQFVTYFHLDQSSNNAMYYAGLGVLYRTTDATNVTSTVGVGATNWTNMGSPPGFGTGGSNEWFVRFATTWGAYNASTSYLLMGGDTGSVLRLDDPQNAANVTTAVDITPTGVTSGVVTGLAIHPTNRDIVLLTYSNYGITNIYLTTNATSATPTWTVVERNLSSHSIRSAAIVEVSGETMYLVGTARGLYSSLDPTSQDWIREAPSLIGFAVVSSMAYRPADNKLLIGTHGNGMFEATISQVLSTEENEFSNSIKVYPNPVQDYLQVELTENLGASAYFKVYNLLGQTVSQGDLTNERIDVSGLDTGLYLVEINADGKRGIKRFIKQ